VLAPLFFSFWESGIWFCENLVLVLIMDNLIIKQKLEDTIEYAYGVFRHFPKSERFTLVADLKRSLTKMLRGDNNHEI